MKISEGFLGRPDPRISFVLIYGPNRGLVSARADALAGTVADDPGDPFQVTVLEADSLNGDPARLADEANALGLSGTRRVVRVRGAGDTQARAFEDLLAGQGCASLVVVEAGDLGPRSSLRRLFEKSAIAGALPCYADEGGSLAAVIRETLAARGLTASRDAMAYLTGNLGADRLQTIGELEKLALYMGDPGTVELADAMAAVGDSAALSLDDVVYAAAGGDRAGLDRTLARAYAGGANPVGVLRACARHLQRLHLAAGMIAHGASPKRAMDSLRPPVFFKLAGAFREQLRLWSPARLADAMVLVSEAEADCKTTGLPAEALCSRALMRIGQAAARPDAPL